MRSAHLPARDSHGLLDELCRLGAALAADSAALEHELHASGDHSSRSARAILESLASTLENASVLVARIRRDLACTPPGPRATASAESIAAPPRR